MEHKSETVRGLVISQLNNFVEDDDEETKKFIQKYQKLINMGLRDNKLTVFNETQTLIMNICTRNQGMEVFFNTDNIEEIKKILKEENEITKMRVYELFVNLSTKNEKTFESCSKSEILSLFLTEIELSENELDILNFLEILKLVNNNFENSFLNFPRLLNYWKKKR
jgi:hypothetical protein